MTSNNLLHVNLFDDLDNFLQKFSRKKKSKDDLLIQASESKEYLADFFEGFLSQFCESEFSIEAGTSHTEYLIKLKNEAIYENKNNKEILTKIVGDIRDILYNRSDYLEQEYLEIAHDFENFIYKVFPNFLNKIKTLLEAEKATDSVNRINVVIENWQKVFDGK